MISFLLTAILSHSCHRHLILKMRELGRRGWKKDHPKVIQLGGSAQCLPGLTGLHQLGYIDLVAVIEVQVQWLKQVRVSFPHAYVLV